MPIVLNSVPFYPSDARTALAQLPESSAVFALYGADAHAEPYVGRTPNLRARLERLLQPSAKHPRRLQLAGRVRRIGWRLTGSDFESLLLQFELLQDQYGPKSLERMHLGHPAFVRFLGGNAFPRITVTHRPSQREADWSYGPFQSRAAAERYAEEMLKLFLLRRCTFELAPDPAYPGCIYSEMKMCLAPCYKGCTDERYAEEAAAVEGFLRTRGDSRLVTLRGQRDQASSNLEFESAAALHAQVQRVEGVRALASELVRPLSQLRAVVLQPSANPGEVAVFLYQASRLRGPAPFSTKDAGNRDQGTEIREQRSEITDQRSEIRDQRSEISESPADDTGIRDHGTEITDQRSEIREQRSEISESPADDTGIRDQGTEITDQRTEIREQRSEISESPADDTGIRDHGTEITDQRSEIRDQRSEISESPAGDELKGTGFSPYVETLQQSGALASEGNQTAPLSKAARGVLEARMEAALAALEETSQAPSATIRQGHLALLKRWYYRPEVRRSGEIFFPDSEGRWPIKAMLRGAGRVAEKMIE